MESFYHFRIEIIVALIYFLYLYKVNPINNILQNPRSPKTLDIVGGGQLKRYFFKFISCQPVIEDIPSVVEDIPPVIEDVPSVIEDIPSVVEDIPPVIEDVPSVIEDIPPVIEDVPSVIEDSSPDTKDMHLFINHYKFFINY